MTENRSGRHDAAFSAATGYFVWPFIAAAAMGDVLSAQAGGIARALSPPSPDAEPLPRPEWSTPHRVRLELPTMELRDFSRTGAGVPTLVCAPFALHGATVADLAPGHSLVEALARNGCGRVFVTDWRSATAGMRLLTIDNYLAELNVAVDEIGPPVDLVGLCQGGWMALIYAARFPAKVRRIVLAGAPIDTEAQASPLAAAAHNLPFGVFDELVRLGDGRIMGERALALWEPALHGGDAAAALQVEMADDARHTGLRERFRTWSDAAVDLPGVFFLEAVLRLFRENQLAEGRFTALGRTIALGDVRHPLFLLAARDDEIVPPGQVLAARGLVGTAPQDVQSITTPGGHLSLYVGADTLREAWALIARWLAQDSST